MIEAEDTPKIRDSSKAAEIFEDDETEDTV